MSRLYEYRNFNEKGKFFIDGDLVINTKDEFDKCFEEITNEELIGRFSFRGCGEAKYKLYSSSQRFWIEKELDKCFDYNSFVLKLIENSKEWNNKTISKFFNPRGIDFSNSIAYLSYMQHFNVPTPLLDFTENPCVGLFFAVQVPLLKLTEYSDSMFYQAMGYASLVIFTLVFICALFPSFQAAKITPASALHED